MSFALTLAGVTAKTTLQKTAIYDAIKKGSFPKPIKLGGSRSAWLESEIDDWLAGCMRGVQTPTTGAKRGRKPKARPLATTASAAGLA
jgi:predicted DNA-binding transcriptional regulator AlpA